MDEPTLRYSNGEITVLWKPKTCIHSGICVRGLNAVFDVKRKPWINILAATTDEIIAQVEHCPSGALSWERAEVG
ncbi:MAG: (4Fe-4S)-binding protein [Chthonomonas sp.]|nr:(4Fe-4S)-binding protein [Chthonomonas sp.]